MVLTFGDADQRAGGWRPRELARWSYAIIPGEHFRYVKRVGKVECVVSGCLSLSASCGKEFGFVSIHESDELTGDGLVGLDTELGMSFAGESWLPSLGDVHSDSQYRYSISLSRGLLGACESGSPRVCYRHWGSSFLPPGPSPADWGASEIFERITSE
jgi:hypothetical protein